jgi:hypothetical protein
MSELGKLGAESRADSAKEQDLHVATRRVADESQDTGQGGPAVGKAVSCDRCGDPIEGRAVHSKGKFYCGDCAEVLKSEQSGPEAPPSPGEEEEPEEPQVGPKSKPKPAEPQPLLTGFEVVCPECKKKLLINHIEYPGGRVDHEVELQ